MGFGWTHGVGRTYMGWECMDMGGWGGGTWNWDGWIRGVGMDGYMGLDGQTWDWMDTNGVGRDTHGGEMDTWGWDECTWG